MLIGEFATKVGLSPDTVRFYGKVGFFSEERRENGYRVYDERDVETARLIAIGKSMGFSLSETLVLCRDLDSGTLDHADVQQRLGDKVERIDAQIRSLRRAKKLLQEQIRVCKDAEAVEGDRLSTASAG